MHTLEQLRSGALAGTTRLDLSCGLTEFPREIFDLADTLEILNLSGNRLSALPADLGRLGKLRILFCSDNLFTEVPAVLGECKQLSMVGFKANQIHTLPGAALPPKLRWLILTDNQLRELPAEIGNCPQLQKLMLAGNQLTALPETLRNCHRLELLRLAANYLPELPAWLLTMPRLTWLAYAGNPFGEGAQAQAEMQHPIREIAWTELEVGRLLGEGASG
ncbi:leucine-rich repeat domain-containing protein [Hymenobacter cellulosilyticus]|uniref:Leucine-rich repeat domain-containing protein n=1 Tax=Hymenobacter cellulosilyticus TaxID=2932248 RepID=A0A8T9Q3G7_9BACT|nr:leucine-rich repeat domain-containing protein [Hymenobacter cellulosilyticus]UOQ69989.1 leucine-rich repeat domain-containing protein [Hymenobacter cellulosilyticus]